MPFGQIEDHTFFTQFLGPDSVVLDLGANHGAFSSAVIDRFGSRCFAVEANPRLAAAISPHPKLTVLNLAVGPEPGVLPFYISAHDEASSLRRPPGIDNPESVSVRVVRIDELTAELGLSRIDLLKVDIEGVETDALAACPDDFLRGVPQITVEFHDFNGMITREAAEQTVARLRSLGFEAVRMWMRSYGDTLFVNRKLAPVGAIDWLWARAAQRNWWWFRRFIARKLGLAR